MNQMKAAALSLVLVAGAAGDASTTKQLLAERRINKDAVHHNASDEFNQALAGKGGCTDGNGNACACSACAASCSCTAIGNACGCSACAASCCTDCSDANSCCYT